MDKRLLYIIGIILLLLLLWFLFMPDADEPTSTTIVSASESGGGKLHEEETHHGNIFFDECCSGTVEVIFDFEWDFYFDEYKPEDDECHHDVEVTVYDSWGHSVYSYDDNQPFSKTERITTGVWDCYNPWRVEVVNGCLYAISYEYDLTMYCYP